MRHALFALFVAGCAAASPPELASPVEPMHRTVDLTAPHPAAACRQACLELGQLDCFTLGERERCVSLCDGAVQSARDAFAACQAASAQCDGLDCYVELDPNAPTGAGPAEAMRCRQGCDQLAAGGCLSAADQSSCRDRCATAPRAQVVAFDAFVSGPSACGAYRPY